jgi:hypothetical protein
MLNDCPNCDKFNRPCLEHREQIWAKLHALEALSRIIRRTLASGQLEKLEDAKPYLSDPPAETPAPLVDPTKANFAALGNEHVHALPAETPELGAPAYPSYCKVTGHVFPCGCASCDAMAR